MASKHIHAVNDRIAPPQGLWADRRTVKSQRKYHSGTTCEGEAIEFATNLFNPSPETRTDPGQASTNVPRQARRTPTTPSFASHRGAKHDERRLAHPRPVVEVEPHSCSRVTWTPMMPSTARGRT